MSHEIHWGRLPSDKEFESMRTMEAQGVSEVDAPMRLHMDIKNLIEGAVEIPMRGIEVIFPYNDATIGFN